MTLGQAKQITRFLLDGELYNQYEEKLNTYFDLGQKRIACTTDFLQREAVICADRPTDIDMTEKDSLFYRVVRVEGGKWQKRSPTCIHLEKGRYRVLYNVYPRTITPHTEENYEFEISQAAQTALPYFVAAQVTTMEHDLRYYQIYYDEFAAILENVDQARRTGNIHILGGERL